MSGPIEIAGVPLPRITSSFPAKVILGQLQFGKASGLCDSSKARKKVIMGLYSLELRSAPACMAATIALYGVPNGEKPPHISAVSRSVLELSWSPTSPPHE